MIFEVYNTQFFDSDLFRDFFNFWTQNQGLWWSVCLLNSSVCCSIPSMELVSCVKKVILIAFVCLTLLCIEIWKNLQILTFFRFLFLFSSFGLEIWVFHEVYDCLIFYFAVIFTAKSLRKKSWLDSNCLPKIIMC